MQHAKSDVRVQYLNAHFSAWSAISFRKRERGSLKTMLFTAVLYVY